MRGREGRVEGKGEEREVGRGDKKKEGKDRKA